MNIKEIKQRMIDQREDLESTFNAEKIIDREVLPNYKNLLKSNLIKAVTGHRRAGKSVLCYQLVRNKNCAYINFDDELLAGLKAEDLNLVLRAFYEIYGKLDYILLDEIQNIEKWELFANRLKRKGINLIITGSNANLLSRELSTHLTGRHFSLEIYPFSFREFLNFYGVEYKKDYFSTRQTAVIRKELEKYILNGGFPESMKEPNPKRYLASLYSDVLTKDIILRHNIKLVDTMKQISNYLISNYSCHITFNKLKNIFGIKSVHTAQDYAFFLAETYTVFFIERFSFKVKERITAPVKVYAIDTGLINALTAGSSRNMGRLYENLTAVELMRRKTFGRGYDVYYWQDYFGREVDFVIKEGTEIKRLMQVCYDVENYDTKSREIKSLLKASEKLKVKRCSLLCITSDYEAEEKHENRVIKFIPLWKWLCCCIPNKSADWLKF